MTTQAQRDKAILDLIDDLLQPEPMPTYEPESWLQSVIKRRWVVGAHLVMVVGLLMVLATFVNPYFWAPADFTVPDLRWALPGALITAASYLYIVLAMTAHRQLDLARIKEQEFAEKIIAKRTDQRAQLLQHLTAAETQRYATMGQFSAEDMRQAQAREQRGWQAQEDAKVRNFELERDRQAQDAASRDLARKLEEERRILESRLNIEHPSADQQAQDRQRRFRSDLEMIDAIEALNQSSDDKTRRRAQQLYDRFDRGKL